MEDLQIRPEEAAYTAIGAYLEPSMGGTNPCGAYAVLKRWYRHASTRVPNPSWMDMDKVRGDFQTLYQREEPHPPGLTLATYVNPVQVNDKIP